MSGEWRSSYWGDEISLEYGKALRDYDGPGKYRVYGSNGPVGWTDALLAQGPGVILGRKGAYRGVEYSKTPFFVIDTAYYVVPKRECNMRWLYYAIKHYKLGEIDDGSPVPSTTRAAVYVKDILVPPPEVQDGVAYILGTLDDKIELNRKMNETLELMARALFKSWFIDFDPVRAKMDGRWKKGQSLPGLPAELFDQFPSSLVIEEAGELPEGWEFGPLSKVSELNCEVWSKGTRPQIVRYVDLSSVKWGCIENVQSYQSAEAPSRAQRVLRPGDTIVGTVRPGNGSFAIVAEEGLTGSTGFAALRPLSSHYREFTYLAATSAANIDSLTHLADGAAYPAVRPEVVAATKVVLPTDAIAKYFSSFVAVLFDRRTLNERESKALTHLRDSLLPKLISGELEIDASKPRENEAVG